jgi:hypothetical protein
MGNLGKNIGAIGLAAVTAIVVSGSLGVLGPGFEAGLASGAESLKQASEPRIQQVEAFWWQNAEPWVQANHKPAVWIFIGAWCLLSIFIGRWTLWWVGALMLGSVGGATMFAYSWATGYYPAPDDWEALPPPATVAAFGAVIVWFFSLFFFWGHGKGSSGDPVEGVRQATWKIQAAASKCVSTLGAIRAAVSETTMALRSFVPLMERQASALERIATELERGGQERVTTVSDQIDDRPHLHLVTDDEPHHDQLVLPIFGEQAEAG